MTHFELPPLFYDHCVAQGLATGEVTGRNSRNVRVEMSEDETYRLYAEAMRYCDVGEHDAELQGVCFSARATVNRLTQQAPHWVNSMVEPQEQEEQIEVAPEPGEELPSGDWLNGRQRVESFGGFSKGDVIRRSGERGTHVVQYIEVFEGKRPPEITAVGGMAGHKQFGVFFLDKVKKMRPIKGQEER